MTRPATQPLPVRRAHELDATPPQARWMIETLWARHGVGLIGGTPKSCKTWLGLEMSVAVATGSPCLGHFAVREPGPVLIYLAEDGLDVVRGRLTALCAHHELDLEALDVHVITAPSLRLDVDQHLARLERTIADVQPRMLLLDPFVRLHRGDENSAQEVAAILASLRTLQRRHGLAVVVTHHTRKNARVRQHGQALRGSGDFHAWGDSMLYLTHRKRKRGLNLTIEHRAAPAPEPRCLRLRDDPPHLELFEPKASKKPSLDERLLETLRRSPGPMRRTELRKVLAVRNSRLGDAMKRLEKLGRIQRSSKGWHA